MLNTKPLVLAASAVLLIVLAIAVGWYFAQAELRARDLKDTLRPIASLLEDDRRILDSLKADGAAESESMLLEAYLAGIRKDGVPKYAVAKQRIDALVNNNTVIVALFDRYVPRARSSAFKPAAEKFRDYAISLRDRWQSVFEIFMAGGNLPAASATMPVAFTDAVAAEISILQ
jgi:hypothetical protein